MDIMKFLNYTQNFNLIKNLFSPFQLPFLFVLKIHLLCKIYHLLDIVSGYSF